MNYKYYTFYLFIKPSFSQGLARIFDFTGKLNMYNFSKTETEADQKAIYLDWMAVGQDFKEAMKQYAQEETTKLEEKNKAAA